MSCSGGRLRLRMVLATVACLAPAAGCSFQEALADGFYGGISDTVAAVITRVLLGSGE